MKRGHERGGSRRNVDTSGGGRFNGGFALLPFIPDPGPGAPATNASWAWSLRRFARAALWLLPVYAVASGVVALAGRTGQGRDAVPLAEQPLRLAGWLGSVWLGVLAMMMLTGLLAAARSRRTACAGLLVGLAGTVLTLPFANLPEQTTIGGTTARQLVLLGATIYSAGWLLTGWAVARSGMLGIGDGALLMVAAPMLGAGGMLNAPLQVLGAMLTVAAGFGIAWRAGRLMPPVGRAVSRPGSRAGAVAAAVPEGGTPAAP